MSMWTWENLREGTGMAGKEDFTWVWILLCWHRRQDLVHSPTSRDNPGQTKRAEINLREPLTPGWEMLWRAWNRGLRRTSGTRGLRDPVESSQIKSPESRVTFTIESKGNFLITWIEGQVFWSITILEKSKPGTENSWEFDWLIGVEDGRESWKFDWLIEVEGG